jgi:hypothetical protein
MSDPGNVLTDDDDYTQIFGVGSELGGVSLLIGFCSVAAYLLTFSGLLDKLEALTSGTSYQLVLQRIYREIMMVGFCSFTFTILNQTNTDLPFGLSKAFGFADICCFAMSSFFCFQGVLIMLLSVKQAQNWNVASQIPAEELLHNMSTWELSHPIVWRSRYFPFCLTREQVEFRVLKSIFATAYNLKATHTEFDFSIFLRMSHENNIVQLIDISVKNWFFILVLTAFASLKLNFWESSCITESCEIEEDIKIFTVCGSVYGLISIVVWWWGRHLELRLIASAGVEDVDDYAVFLMTEFRTEENLADCATSPILAKDVISNFLKEKEIHEVRSKEEQYVKRHIYFKRLSVNGADRRKPAEKYAAGLRRIQSQGEVNDDSSGGGDEEEEGWEGIDEIPCVGVSEGSDDESSHFFDTTGSGGGGGGDGDDQDAVEKSSREAAGERKLQGTKSNTRSLSSVEAPAVLNSHKPPLSLADNEANSEHSTSDIVQPIDEAHPELSVKPKATPSSHHYFGKNNASVSCIDVDDTIGNQGFEDVPVHVSVSSSAVRPNGGASKQNPTAAVSDCSAVSDESNNKKKGLKKLPSHENKLLNRGGSMIVKRKKKSLFRMSSGRRLSFLNRKKGKF